MKQKKTSATKSSGITQHLKLEEQLFIITIGITEESNLYNTYMSTEKKTSIILENFQIYIKYPIQTSLNTHHLYHAFQTIGN